MQNTPLIFDFNEQIDSLQFTVVSGAIDSVSFESTRFDSSIQIILKPPFASYDSITVNFSYLEDQAGLSTVDISYTYITPILGDYDLDSAITYNDLMDLVENWEFENYNYELAPVVGIAPHFVSFPNSKFDIEDGMAFMQMWSWYQKEFGEINTETIQVGPPLDIFENDNNIFIVIDDSIASGQLQLAYDIGTTPVQFSQRLLREKELFMNSHFPNKGFSIIEFARTGQINKDTLKLTLEESSEIRLSYKFDTNSQPNAQRGYIDINHDQIPTKVALYPDYPNPEVNEKGQTTYRLYDQDFKSKKEKVAFLKENDSESLRMVIKSSFDPKIVWLLPEGEVPYSKNDAPAGTEHTSLATESRKLWHIIKGGDRQTPQFLRK